MPDSRRFTNQTSAAQVLYGDYEQKHGDGANPAPKQPAGARNASATLLTGWTQPQGDPAFDPHLRDQPGPAPGRGVVLRGEAPDWAEKIGADQPRLTESAPLATRSTMPDGVQTGVSFDLPGLMGHYVQGRGDPVAFQYDEIGDVKPSDFESFRNMVQTVKPGETRRVDMNLGNYDHGSWTTGNLHHDFNGTVSRDSNGKWRAIGRMSAHKDKHDFNDLPKGNRTSILGLPVNEWATDAGRALLPGKKYDIHYLGHKDVTEEGE